MIRITRFVFERSAKQALTKGMVHVSVSSFFKGLFGSKQEEEPLDPKNNPYFEEVCVRVPVTVQDEETVIEVRWIKNADAKVKGGQATFAFGAETIPVVISSPTSEKFSMGINITIDKALMPKFHEELQRLQDEGAVSERAKLSYNSEYKHAIFYRRSDAKAGNTDKWKTLVQGNMQGLIDDFSAVMPFVMGVYGE